MGLSQPCIDEIAVSTYSIPTDAPESDGTLSWDSTTLVLAEIRAGDQIGLGYTYGNKAIAVVAGHLGEKCLGGQPALDTSRLYLAMLRQVRNDGSRGISSMAISALDIALWDLKARLLGCSVTVLLGISQLSVAAYGSGGFTSYSNARLAKQLAGWVKSGIRSVKMKIGTHPESDPERVSVAREAIGPDVALFVDANGAFNAKQAITMAECFKKSGVSWFEEPVSSDRLNDMRRVRDAVQPEIEVAAGEYGYDSLYFRQMLEAEAVDVLQIDATRCKGFTGFLEGAAVAASFGCPVSAHCAPTLHAHIGSAVSNFRHVEYFHDHVRIENMLFDGFIEARNGRLQPDFSCPGLGLAFKRKDAERYRA